MARNAYISSPSTVQILTTAEAKTHLRVDFSDDNDYIDSLVLAAQDVIENYCNIKIMDVTITQRCDSWYDSFELYFSPVQNSGKASIEHIKYYNDAATPVLTTWAASNYDFDKYSAPLRVSLADLDSVDGYPNISSMLNAIEITYKIGYSSSSDVPKALKQACLILVGQWYENRQEAVVGRSVGRIPMTATYLMNRYRITDLGLN
tara:strand:- start:1712 stop:2326 length:615 start_codon:yes stop_codon:yes gene_type:complete